MVPRRLHVQRIDQRLAEMNLTRDGFKAEVGLDRRTTERLLSGKTQNAQAETVNMIAKFLGLQPRDILLLPDVNAAPSRSMPAVAMRLPVTGAHLLGRAQELAWLDQAWACGETNIVCIVALGGAGKSALVNHWVSTLAHDNWRGAQRVFGWTFASQGIQETVASADGFLDAALRFCADPEPSLGTPSDKGYRLAQLLRGTRTLLVLDGLEPFQYPPGPYDGQVKDPALATLLQALALHNLGLCVITTRLAVADIATFQDTTAPVLALDTLSEDTGAALLQTLGCTGSVAERRATARECRGHALTVQLLGTYLRDVYGGDMRRRHEIAALDAVPEEGGQAWRVMASYEQWFGPGPEVAVLRLLGLFDRVASAEDIAVLRAEPRIPALNEALIGVPEHQWLHALRRVRTAGLVAPADPHNPHALDAHPLVRAYYRRTLRTQHPAAWRAGHERLFSALQDSVVEEFPATMEELLPLYAAVAHGCLAGRVQDALRVFRHRIHHGDQQFSSEQLGAFGVDLATLAHGFAVLWSAVVPGLPADDQLFLFHAAGECLSALGRVHEAQAPLQHALALAHQHHNWTIAALAATRLSEVYRAQGDLTTALRYAEQGAVYVRHPGVPPQVQILSHTYHGFALHWVGKSVDAQATFQEAERVQHDAHPERPILHRILGYMYSELLLDQLASQAEGLTPAQCRQAWDDLHRRIAQALTWAQQDRLPCDIGLHHVSMGRVYILAWQHPHAAAVSPETAQAQAVAHVTSAVESLRLSNHRNYVPRALLTRAALSRVQGQFMQAQQDIDEALAMAQSSAMDVYQADAYLEQATLHLAAWRAAPHVDHCRQAAVSLDTARTLIDKMHYDRRRSQVAELEVMLRSVAAHGTA